MSNVLKNGMGNYEFHRGRLLPRTWEAEMFVCVEDHLAFCRMRKRHLPVVNKAVKKMEDLGNVVHLEGRIDGCFERSLSLELKENLQR